MKFVKKKSRETCFFDCLNLRIKVVLNKKFHRVEYSMKMYFRILYHLKASLEILAFLHANILKENK